MTELEFQKKVAEIMLALNGVPLAQRKKLEALVAQTKDQHADLKKNMEYLKTLLDDLRLVIKYMVFDIEATRRENKLLRSLLQDAGENGV